MRDSMESMAASLVFVRRSSAVLHNLLNILSPLRGFASAAMSFLRVSSSHVIPTGGCAIAWNLWLRHYFYRAGVPLCFTAALPSGRPFRALCSSHVIPACVQQPCHPRVFAAAMSSPHGHVRWHGNRRFDEVNLWLRHLSHRLC